MKRMTQAVLCLLILLLLLPVAVDAETNAQLEQAIIDSCTYGKKVDLEQYQLTRETLKEQFDRLMDAGRLPWYALATYTYYYDEVTGTILEFEPDLLPEAAYDRALYAQRKAEVLDACVQEGMEDWQIALAIHDYLITNTAYDQVTEKNTGYDLLISGTTMCAGYTDLYRDLLLEAGIDCISVTSAPMEHTWNLVCLDGQWYHVDVTWDDPTPDTYGYVRHEFFLLTDEEISAGDDPHYDWVTDIRCTDTRYSDAFWRDVKSAIVFTDPDTCYLIREKKFVNTLYKRTLSTGKEKKVYKETRSYVDIGQGNYSYRHNGLSLWNGRLWLSTLNQVLSMKPDGSDVRTEFSYPASQNEQYLEGCYVYGDTLYYTTSPHEGDGEKHEKALSATGYHVHQYTPSVIASTCVSTGYTQWSCDCGILCQSSPTDRLTHAFETVEKTDATIFNAGFLYERCVNCGEEHTETQPRVSVLTFLRENGKIAFLVVLLLVTTLTRVGRRKKTAA